MKQHFEDTLRVFSDVTKDAKVDEPLREVRNRLQEKDLEEMVPDSARLQVFELQEKKKTIMKWLHQKLEAIDRNEEVRSIHKENEHNKDYYVDENMNVEWKNEMVQITKGDLATDGEWELLYKLDKKLPRDVKKEFVVAEAKREMRDLLDKQIATTEAKREIPKWIDGPAKAYMKAVKGGYGGVASGNKPDLTNNAYLGGLVAEKLITTQMEKFEIDNNAPYQFYHGDVFDDYERKVDGFLVIPKHTRGVKAVSEDRKDFGIQLYVGGKQAQRQRKEEQLVQSKRDFGLDDIDDLVLVTIPDTHSQDVYKQWIKEGKKPGGPEKLWGDTTQEKVFYGILKDFFKESTIDEMWEGSGKIKRNFEEFPEDTKNVRKLKERLRGMLRTQYPDAKLKKKIEELKQELELIRGEIPKTVDILRKIYEEAGVQKKEIKKTNSPQQKSKQESQSGPVKVYTAREIAEFQDQKDSLVAKPVKVEINGLDKRFKSLLEVQNPSKKVLGRIKDEIWKMKMKINTWSHMENPSDRVKSKIGLEKQKLEEVLKLFPGENKEVEIGENEKTDEEKIEELKQRIENGIGNPSESTAVEKEPERKMSAGELAQRAEELLRSGGKNGAVKIYTPEEIADFQRGKTQDYKEEPKREVKQTQSVTSKFNQKFGKWFGKKK